MAYFRLALTFGIVLMIWGVPPVVAKRTPTAADILLAQLLEVGLCHSLSEGAPSGCLLTSEGELRGGTVIAIWNEALSEHLDSHDLDVSIAYNYAYFNKRSDPVFVSYCRNKPNEIRTALCDTAKVLRAENVDSASKTFAIWVAFETYTMNDLKASMLQLYQNIANRHRYEFPEKLIIEDICIEIRLKCSRDVISILSNSTGLKAKVALYQTKSTLDYIKSDAVNFRCMRYGMQRHLIELLNLTFILRPISEFEEAIKLSQQYAVHLKECTSANGNN